MNTNLCNLLFCIIFASGMKRLLILLSLQLAVFATQAMTDSLLMVQVARTGVLLKQMQYDSALAQVDRLMPTARQNHNMLAQATLHSVAGMALLRSHQLENGLSKILINTIHKEMWVVNRMIENKVDGVMYKTIHLDQLLEAIIAVLDGQKFYCPKFQESMNKLQMQNVVLTKREIDVVRSIAMGLSTKEIAHQLFISENTVESHRQKIFEKLGVRNMAELIVKAIADGYINVKIPT